MPLVYSILGDLVSSTGRTEASGMVGISIGIGQGMGQVNFVSHFFVPWQETDCYNVPLRLWQFAEHAVVTSVCCGSTVVSTCSSSTHITTCLHTECFMYAFRRVFSRSYYCLTMVLIRSRKQPRSVVCR